MKITKSKMAFYYNNKLYTFLEKDEDSEIKFYYNGTYINLVTKDEVLTNLPNIKYLDTCKIYYVLHGQCVQLGLYEDLAGGTYKLTFNDDTTTLINNSKVTTHKQFTTSLDLNVKKEIEIIKYTKDNLDLTYNNIINPVKDGMIVKVSSTGYVVDTIDMKNDSQLRCVGTEKGELKFYKIAFTIVEKEYNNISMDNCLLTNTIKTQKGATLEPSGVKTYRI